jgi:hypothetical protein
MCDKVRRTRGLAEVGQDPERKIGEWQIIEKAGGLKTEGKL